jgi:hypothetical protein
MKCSILTITYHFWFVVLFVMFNADMTNREIAQIRLHNQRIGGEKFKTANEVVQYMGAVQAQDYAGAKWALGLRMKKSNDTEIDKALNDGAIIRTHVLRPTWHFVTPADARWMIELTAPRINAQAAFMYRQQELDATVFRKSNDALAKAFEGGKKLDRLEIKDVLQKAGIATSDLRFVHLLMRAELDKVICSGGRQGNQFTYALFDDVVPQGGLFNKEEALAKLAATYFISRGPATLQDFTWWSGLAGADTKAALEIVKSALQSFKIGNLEYWMDKDTPSTLAEATSVYLLPAYDEFAVSYKDRSAIINPKYTRQTLNVIFNPSIIMDEQIVGTWKRIIKKSGVIFDLNLLTKLNKTQTKAIGTAKGQYLKFINI